MYFREAQRKLAYANAKFTFHEEENINRPFPHLNLNDKLEEAREIVIQLDEYIVSQKLVEDKLVEDDPAGVDNQVQHKIKIMVIRRL